MEYLAAAVVEHGICAAMYGEERSLGRNAECVTAERIRPGGSLMVR